MALEVPDFKPWMERKLQTGKAIYFELWWFFLHPALLSSSPLFLLLHAFLKTQIIQKTLPELLSQPWPLLSSWDEGTECCGKWLKQRWIKGECKRRGSFILLGLCVRLFKKRSRFLGLAFKTMIWLLSISNSSDPIVHQLVFNTLVFSNIQNCSHACKFCRIITDFPLYASANA